MSKKPMVEIWEISSKSKPKSSKELTTESPINPQLAQCKWLFGQNHGKKLQKLWESTETSKMMKEINDFLKF